MAEITSQEFYTKQVVKAEFFFPPQCLLAWSIRHAGVLVAIFLIAELETSVRAEVSLSLKSEICYPSDCYS